MAKVTTTPGEPVKKAARKAVVSKAAATKEEGGATAPVSSSGDQAAATPATPPATPGESPAAAADTPAAPPAEGSGASDGVQESADAGASIEGSAAKPLDVIVIGGDGPLFPGMGRFPPDWKPEFAPVFDGIDPPPAPELEDGAEQLDTDADAGPELAQTDEFEGSELALKSSAWGLPDIAEFPAELTFENNSRSPVVLRSLNTRIRPFCTSTVICPTASKYDAIQRELATRALRERWDSKIGLQVVKHGED